LKNWPKHPLVYEINTWPWLESLARRHGRPVDLGSVPEAEWDRLASLGVDAVWLMGVFERSSKSAAIARAHPGLQEEFQRALPGYGPEDVVGSPYAVRTYQVDVHLGSDHGLQEAREQLALRGMGLMLDFVPNHTAIDHPWVQVDPACYVCGDMGTVHFHPEAWFQAGSTVVAHGKDPYFAPWTDTAQLNAFADAYRAKAIQTLRFLASRCDGVRCDMAMLLLSDVFQKTWGDRAGKRPATEFWAHVIPQVRLLHPNFRFVAEAYWDTESALINQGFDFCYDKRLYDGMLHGDAGQIRSHLAQDPEYQGHLVRFIENHDEPRANTVFPQHRLRPALLAAMTLPGMKLLHEGQMEGKHARLPVQLGRQPNQASDPLLAQFHKELLEHLNRPEWKEGTWQMAETWGWPDNQSHHHLLAWSFARETARWLVCINWSDSPLQARLRLPWQQFSGPTVILEDVLTGARYCRSTAELRDAGLYVALEGWHSHLLRIVA